MVIQPKKSKNLYILEVLMLFLVTSSNMVFAQSKAATADGDFIVPASDALRASVKKPVVLGLTHLYGESYQAEFERYNFKLPIFKANKIKASVIPRNAFLVPGTATKESLLAMFRQFHVVQLTTAHEGMSFLTDDYKAHAEIVGQALEQYVREGGGLLLNVESVRYPGEPVLEYWNLVFSRFGIQVLREGLYDKTTEFMGADIYPAIKSNYWLTEQVTPHAVTEGVKCMALPRESYDPFPGTPAIAYNPDWTIVVSGGEGAKSYKMTDKNQIDINTEGTYTSRPPVIGVRSLGQGRIVCLPLAEIHSGLNWGNPIWPHTVELKGNKQGNKPSDTMRLMLNAYLWLGIPALEKSELGTYKFLAYQPVQFPTTCSLDGRELPAPTPGVRGIVGAHSAYSDGQGTIKEYVNAAKAAGLSFIVFTESLDKMTKESFEKFKQECAEITKSEPGFLVAPGLEITDILGLRHFYFGQGLVYPEATRQSNQYSYDAAGNAIALLPRAFPQWDGKVLHLTGVYTVESRFCGHGMLDYRDFAPAKVHPENQWWFWNYAPLVYDKDQLVADNFQSYLDGLRDLYWALPISFTRIYSPAEVQKAATTLVTGVKDLATAREAFESPRCTSYNTGYNGNIFVSQGPVVEGWWADNTHIQNWRYTRGGQRVPLTFTVSSENGIKEVKVHDANRGIIRRFDGKGSKRFTKNFELVHDRDHYLVLEVIDNAGRRALSKYIYLYSYKSSLFRCGDNLNILGGTQMIWHPDRSQMFQMGKYFYNAQALSIQGWDRGDSQCPVPTSLPQDQINIKDIGYYPPFQKGLLGKIMSVDLASYQMQIATMTMTKIVERYGNGIPDEPALNSLPRDLEDNEYFERTHTIHAPLERTDFFVVWDHRRPTEGTKDLQGMMIVHSGEFKFKKDLTLADTPVPIPLVISTVPIDFDNGWGDTAIITDRMKGRIVAKAKKDKPLALSGQITPGGYAALLPTVVGYEAFLAPMGNDFSYACNGNNLTIGLGRPGQTIKAGTVLPYRFAYIGLTDTKDNPALLASTARTLNLKGETNGYPITMKAGQIRDASIFLSIEAKDREAQVTLGAKPLFIDLPIQVAGVQDNGCAAVYTKQRPWFRFISVEKDTAYFQEPIDAGNEIWAGNIFVSDHPAIKLTAIIDGQDTGKAPKVEVHNPTGNSVTTVVSSPTHTPQFGGKKITVTIPAGESIWLQITNDELKIHNN